MRAGEFFCLIFEGDKLLLSYFVFFTMDSKDM